MLLENYIEQLEYKNLDDFLNNFKINVPTNFNFAYDVVDCYAEQDPNRLAIIWTNVDGDYKEVTFAQLKDESDKAAAYFQSLGLKRGDKVMLILKRRIEFWYSIIALHKLGVAVIPATHLLTKKDIEYRVNAASIKCIVAVNDSNVMDQIDLSIPESPDLKYRISIGERQDREGWLNYNEGCENADKFERPSGNEATQNSDISLLYFTSGTTGNPKMVGHDFTYPLAHIVTAKYWQNVEDKGIHLTVSDTGWGKAAWGKLYGQWLSGATVFVYDFDKFIPEDMLNILSKHKVTSFCAPPTVYRFLIRENFSKFNLSSLKYAAVAGEPLSPEVFNRFHELTGLKLMEGFGQTETALQIATFPWMDPKPGSMGIPSPLYHIDLVKVDGSYCEEGETGQVVIRTKDSVPLGLFTGYYRDTELTNKVYHNNTYHTGDLAWRDEDGYYWFVGRVDDVIKSSGYRIGPFEVESALMTHPAVVECAVTGAPDDVRGQIVKATIVLAPEFKPGSQDLIKEIQNHVKQTTAPYKYPRLIQFTDALPKTISGKVRRVELREKANK